jgi:hypothetical protein
MVVCDALEALGRERRERRPALAVKFPGKSAETGSLARTTCVWTTRSVAVI